MAKVLIIGGTGGLASHFKSKLTEQNYEVSITSRHVVGNASDEFKYNPMGKKISKDLQNHLISVDHILFNIGSGNRKSNMEFEPDNWGASMRINFQYLIDFLNCIEKSDFGRIKTVTFISSIAAFMDVGAPIAYSISKNAINALTPILAKKWAPRIRVNTICPGNIFHETSVWKRKLENEPRETNIFLTENVPMKKFGTTDELFNTFEYIINMSNQSVTGQLFRVDGGQTII